MEGYENGWKELKVDAFNKPIKYDQYYHSENLIDRKIYLFGGRNKFGQS